MWNPTQARQRLLPATPEVYALCSRLPQLKHFSGICGAQRPTLELLICGKLLGNFGKFTVSRRRQWFGLRVAHCPSNLFKLLSTCRRCKLESFHGKCISRIRSRRQIQDNFVYEQECCLCAIDGREHKLDLFCVAEPFASITLP